MTAMVGGRSRRLALVVLAAVIVAGVAFAWRTADDAGDDRVGGAETEPGSDIEPRFLDLAEAHPVDDELWVLGGAAGPVGSRPMISAAIPEGWQTNRAAIIYAADGTVRERFLLPDLGGRASGQMFDHRGDRLLIGTVCGGDLGCGQGMRHVMVRFPSPDAERQPPEIVPLDLPALPLTDSPRSGLFTAIGIVGDLAWLEQNVEVPLEGGGTVGVIRAVVVDVNTGIGTEVPLPDGWNRPEGMCILDDHVYRSTARGDDGEVTSMSLHRRPATVDGEWEEVGALDPGDGNRHTTTRCLDEMDEVVVAVHAFPTQLWTHTVDTEGFAPPARLTGLERGDVLGTVVSETGEMLAVAEAGSNSRRVFLTRQKGGPWIEASQVDWRVRPAIVGGRLVDVSKATEATHVPAPAFEVIDLHNG